MMDEKTALTGTTTTTTTTTKEKKRPTPLILVLFTFAALLFVGLAFSSAGRPMHGGTSLAGSVHPQCVKSAGTYDSQKDYCYTCGGTSDSGKLGYCWNSQTPQCVPDCGNMKGVSGVGNNQCGDPCDGFLDYQNASNGWLCDDMGYFWYKGSCMTVEEAKNYSF